MVRHWDRRDSCGTGPLDSPGGHHRDHRANHYHGRRHRNPHLERSARACSAEPHALPRRVVRRLGGAASEVIGSNHGLVFRTRSCLMTRWPRLVGESSGGTAVPSVRPAGLRAVQCEGGGARSASPWASAGSSIFGEETRQAVQTLHARYRAERPANRVSPGRSYAVHPSKRKGWDR